MKQSEAELLLKHSCGAQPFGSPQANPLAPSAEASRRSRRRFEASCSCRELHVVLAIRPRRTRPQHPGHSDADGRP